MARFTIELPEELGAATDGVDRSRTAVTDRAHTGTDRGAPDRATRRFVSWVATWAGA